MKISNLPGLHFEEIGSIASNSFITMNQKNKKIHFSYMLLTLSSFEKSLEINYFFILKTSTYVASSAHLIHSTSNGHCPHPP